jgi:uncharacterized protein
MDASLRKKYDHLITTLKQYGSAAVAFSGGVDSTFLAKAAYDALGGKALALTVDSQAYPPDSITLTRQLAHDIGIGLIEIPADVRDIPMFCDNPPDRCYHCKKMLFTMMLERARSMGIDILMDGSNVDDDDDYRPGHRALRELGIVSPLKDHGFTKEEIRAVSRELGLPTWNLQSFACLASRFPYGDTITPELLARTAEAEDVLRDLGINRYRVRNHGDIARIEVDSAGFDVIAGNDVRHRVVGRLKSLGYTYVTLDLEGYRTGSMNETLKPDDVEEHGATNSPQ